MAELLDQLYAGLAFILPGFVALHAGFRIYGVRMTMGDLEKSTWSLFLSLGVLGFYLLATRQHLTDVAANPGVLVTPANLFALLLIVVITTAVVVAWLFVEPLEWLNKKFWKGKGGWRTSKHPMEVFLDGATGRGLLIETASCRYYGTLVGFGWLEGAQAVRIAAQHTLEWNEATRQETTHPYVADLLIPWDQVVSLALVSGEGPSTSNG